MLYQFLSVFAVILVSVGSSAPVIFTFGCLRMGCSDVESAGALAGYLATIQYANTYNLVPGVQFRLNVTTIPCQNYTGCAAVTRNNSHHVRDFLAAMPGYSAVFKPNFILANTVVDEATRLGGIPVLDPDDIRTTTFGAGYDHIINFNHNWQRQLDHIFTYMLQTGRCAKSGIIYGANNSNYIPYVNSMTKLFTDGGYSAPPSGDFTKMTDAQVRAFFQEPNRNCFVLLGSNYFSKYVLYRLNTLGINPTSLNFYGVATLSTDYWSLFGVTSIFSTINFVHWVPVFDSAVLKKAFAEWLPNTASYASLFAAGNGETLPTAIVPNTNQGYLVMMFAINTFRAAIAKESAPNTTGFLPLTWNKIVDEFYEESRLVDGVTFNALVRACPRAPATQICYCNVLTRTSYVFAVNTTTTLAYPVYDVYLLAQRGVASLEFPSTCGYFASAWSYPITGLVLFPTNVIGGSFRTLEEEAYAMYSVAYISESVFVNYAATAPTRALRYASYDIKTNESADVALEKYIASLKPFVIYGSMSQTITNPRGTLTLDSNMLEGQLEEPELVPHSAWRWDILVIEPVIADYVHSLIAYYAQEPTVYTSIHAIACSQREAELVSMSFATWGFDFPVSSVVISADPAAWATFATTRLSSSSNPFVIAVTQNNTDSVVETISAAAGPIGRGVLAIACTLSSIYYAKPLVTFNGNGQGDIIFGSYRSEWWTPAVINSVVAILRPYALNPLYHQAILGMNVAKQLYLQVYYDYATTAAEVLYKTSVISASETSFGPFSNTTCTDEEIAANTRDRTCQCTKGVRRIFVMSLRSYQEGVVSDRTGGYSWAMTTCGVVYSPYVPPTDNSNRLSSGAIAGIAVGASLGLLLLIGAFVANALFSGRNNRAAPKDASQPFAIVFTDIQSSTALWARAPAAMSEAVDQHHELMRKALRRNGGYEVKTVGDCFMIAFKDPVDATTFSLDIQVMLHGADWSEELDATYLELIAEAEVAASPTAGDDVSTQSEGMPIVRTISTGIQNKAQDCMSGPQSVSLTENVSQSNRISFTETPRLGETPGLGESQGDRLNLPSVIITHSRTPNQSIQLSKQASPFGVQEASGTFTDDEELFGAYGPWHGLRVRIGVHYGMGDIRKDPVSQGYDYYGTVVNTAARVEGVGHGGQTLLTDVVFDALPAGFAKSNDAVIIALGPQPLRGLDAPIALYQMVPATLQSRRFPALRLHVEKETEESSVTDTTTGTTTSETPEVLVSRICGSKQFANVAPEEIMDRYNYFLATFGPSTDKYKSSVIAKLGESWGFEKAGKLVHTDVGRIRLLVSLIAKVTKAYHSNKGATSYGKTRYGTTVTHTSMSNGNHYQETVSMSEAVKSIHQAQDTNSLSGRLGN